MDKQDLGKIDEQLDIQLANFPSGKDILTAKRTIVIKNVSTTIEKLYVNGIDSGLIVCGVASLDGIYYGALYDIRTHLGYVEELHLTPSREQIKSIKLINDPTEWAILNDFFLKQNVWEVKRISTWIMGIRDNSLIVKDRWLKNINSKIKKGKLLTNKDLIKATYKNIRRNSAI